MNENYDTTDLKEESTELNENSLDTKSQISPSDKLNNEVTVNFWNITKLLLTIFFTCLIYFVDLFLQGHFIGQYGDLELIKAFNVYMIIRGIFYCSFVDGIIEGIPVICSKSFGNSDFKKMGYELHQVFIFSYISLLIGHILYSIFSKKIMLFIASGLFKYLDQTYLATQILFFGMYFHLLSEIFVRFFQSQNEILIVNILTFIAMTLYPIIIIIFLGTYKLGLLGCSLAFGVFGILKMTVIIIYLKFYHKYPESIFFFRKESFEMTNVLENLFICLKIMISYLSDYTGLLIVSIFSNRLILLENSQFIILTILIEFNFAFSNAIFSTSSIFIGNCIGENSPHKLIKGLNILLKVIIVFQLMITTLVIIFYKYISMFLINNSNVYIGMFWYVLFLGLCFLLFSINNYLFSILRSSEFLDVTSLSTFLGFMIVMPSFAYILSIIYHLGVWGNLFSIFITYFIINWYLFDILL